MNWCYYFIDLQQKAIFSKNWGGPEKDRFLGVFFWVFFIFFFWFFLKSFCFQGWGSSLSLLSSNSSSLLPLFPPWFLFLFLLLVHQLDSLLLLLLYLFLVTRGQCHIPRYHRLLLLFFLSLLCKSLPPSCV